MAKRYCSLLRLKQATRKWAAGSRFIATHVPQDHSDADAAQRAVRDEIDSLLQIIAHRPTTMIVVSGEVGMGLVPETSLGRLFRDLLGWSNQCLASHAAATYFMLAGLPVNATRLASTVELAASELACHTPQGTQP